jgi:Tol biopolymer transport system component
MSMRRGSGRFRFGTRLFGTVAAASVLVLALSGSAFVTRASVSNGGAPANYATPTYSDASISDNGRYVAFDSAADNLVGGADGGVFVRDTWSGATTAASVKANGYIDGAADTPAISGDGRFVAFVSDTANVLPGGNGRFYQVFLRDQTLGVTSLVSAKTNGAQATDDSGAPSLSANGRYIAFESDSPGLVAGDMNDWTDVFVRDRLTNTTKRISLMSDGTEAFVGGESPSISSNGKMVAFTSYDTLTPNDTNPNADVYVRNVASNTTSLVSVKTGGAVANGTSGAPRISGNGRFVVFTSDATNLDGVVDTNGGMDVFVRDLATGTTQRASLSSTGGLAHGAASRPSISNNGRFVSYESTAADAVAGDTNGVPDTFVYDRQTGQTQRMSTDQSGAQLTQGGAKPLVSGDARILAFASDAQITGLSASTSGQLYTRLRISAATATPPVEVSIGNAAVVEGDLRARQLRFTVSLSRPSTSAVKVHYATAPRTATAGSDFLTKSGTLTIPAGSTSGVIPIMVKGDRQVEAQEAFTVRLSAPVGARIHRALGTGSIITDDNPSNPAVGISVGNAAIVEGDSGNRALRFPVTLSATSPARVTVRYTTAAGTAGSADFAARSGTVTFPARSVSNVINIWVKPDLKLETNETFKVKLSLPTGATIHRATGTGTILDDG